MIKQTVTFIYEASPD